MAHHARRRHDEEARVGLVGSGLFDRGEHLHGLAEPHVVGEDAAQPVAAQKVEPAEALLLVLAQVGAERAGRIAVLDAVVSERAHRLDPGGVLRIEHTGIGELLPEVDVVSRQRRMVGRRVVQRLRLGEHIAQRGEALVGEGEHGAAQ